MARNVNGSVTTTEQILSSLTTAPVQRSFFIRFYQNGAGGAGFGTLFGTGNGTSSGTEIFTNGTSNHQLQVYFSTTQGEWQWAIPSQNVWHTLGLNYDNSSVSNDPVVYIDGVSVSVTNTLRPVGTLVAASPANLTIGNLPNNGVAWDGNVADAAVWDGVLLTATEHAALGRGARPYQIRKGSLKGWWPLDGFSSPEPDLSGNANNGTLTGTTRVFGPPMMAFTPRWPQFIMPPVTPVVIASSGYVELDW